MALQQDHTFKGVTVTGAYHRVEYVAGNKDGLNVDISVYKDATEAADKANSLDNFSFKIVDTDLVHDDGASDKNYTKQAYEHMKAAAFDDVSGVSRDYTSATAV
jgi:hypothetical protein